MFERFSKDELTFVAATVAAIAVLVSAFISSVTARRGKYVDTIAAQRIKWVAELREDIRQFLLALDKQHHAFLTRKDDAQALNASVHATNERLTMIQLKLNMRDKLDLKLVYVLRRAIEIARGGNSETYWTIRNVVVFFSALRLKEEWEVAKIESAGFIRRLYLFPKKWLRAWTRERVITDNPEMAKEYRRALADEDETVSAPPPVTIKSK